METQVDTVRQPLPLQDQDCVAVRSEPLGPDAFRLNLVVANTVQHIVQDLENKQLQNYWCQLITTYSDI